MALDAESGSLDADPYGPSGPDFATVLRTPALRSGFVSAVLAMTLAMFGEALLPVPWAFSMTGATVGMSLLLTGALANAFTCWLLMRQLYATGARDYESLAFCIGGKTWKFVTQLSIVLVLVGTIMSVLPQMGEACTFAAQQVWGEGVPEWLRFRDGAAMTVILALAVAMPICAVEQMSELDRAGMIGSVIPVAMLVMVISQALYLGLPAISSGEFEIVEFKSWGQVAQAMSVFTYGAFIQPMMMPLVAEMPGNSRTRTRIVLYATLWVVLVHAVAVYGLLGFFGAALFGQETRSNVLRNQILPQGLPQGVLGAAFAGYLAISVPTCELPARQVLDSWLPGDPEVRPRLRHAVETTLLICGSLVVVLLWGAESGLVIVITGATAVFLCSYAVPIANHFLLYFNRAQCQLDALAKQAAAEESRQEETRRRLLVPASDGPYLGRAPSLQRQQSLGRRRKEVLLAAETFQSLQYGPRRRGLSSEEVALLGVDKVIGEDEHVDRCLEYRLKKQPGLWGSIYEVVVEVIMPLSIFFLGAIMSVLTLWVAFIM